MGGRCPPTVLALQATTYLPRQVLCHADMNTNSLESAANGLNHVEHCLTPQAHPLSESLQLLKSPVLEWHYLVTLKTYY